MYAPHTPGVVQVSETSLRQFAALLLQPLAAVALHPSPILVGPLLFLSFPFSVPVPPAAIRFRDIAAHPLLVEIGERRATVIALVGHHFLDFRLLDLPRRRLRFLQGLAQGVSVP